MAGDGGTRNGLPLPNQQPTDGKDERAGDSDGGSEQDELDEADCEQERRAEERERSEACSPRPDPMLGAFVFTHRSLPLSRKPCFALGAPPSCPRRDEAFAVRTLLVSRTTP